MKKLLLLIFAFALCYGCANSQQEQTTPNPATTTKTSPKTKTTNQSTPANNIRANRPNVIKSTARSASKINKVFPYDIDLKDANGKVMNSSSLLKNNGKPTVLMFWLTTCYPCKIELKAIKAKYDQWIGESDFNMVAISTDFMKNEAAFQKMAKENGWKWQVYHDFNREFRQVMPGGLNGLPQTFIIDANGEIVYHKRKYSTGDEDVMYAVVKKLAMK